MNPELALEWARNRAQDTAARVAIEGEPERDHFTPSNDNAPAQERMSDRAPAYSSWPVGDWMQTFTGKAVYPLSLRPADIDIRDIAHSLSMQCRYAGHSQRFYSVAEHSVHVARFCRQYGTGPALEGLLHDATEAYLVDVPRPVKPFLTGYKQAERRASHAVAQRFNLDMAGHPSIVHETDNRIMHDERAALMTPCSRDWSLTGQPLGVTIECWSPDRAEREFLALFDELYGED